MTLSAPSSTAPCPRCGQLQPTRLLVGGLCPACLARRVHLDLLSELAADEPGPEEAAGTGVRADAGAAGLGPVGAGLEEKEPVSVQIQGYLIQDLVGGGSMGEVYRAVMAGSGKEVAMRLLAGRLTRDPEVVERFSRQIKAQAGLNHPNLVRLLDLQETEGGRHAIIAEYVSGCDLERLLRAGKPHPEQALDFFLKACEGVAHAHKHAVLHCDINPSHILVGAGGVVKVADFALARMLADPALWYSFVCGQAQAAKLAYAAPETQEGGNRDDPRVDVYALGVVLHELLAGALPPGPEKCLPVCARVEKRLPGIIAAATARRVDERTPSVELLAESVRVVRRALRRRRRWRRWVAAFSAALALLALGLAAGSWLGHTCFSTGRLFYPSPAAASAESPWSNSLGMTFVPVPGTQVLFSQYETRVREYEEYASMDSAILPDWRPGPPVRDGAGAEGGDAAGGKDRERGVAGAGPGAEGDAARRRPSWRSPGPGFDPQSPQHPVCMVTLTEARLFCAWLTWKERLEGRIGQGQRYRLPTSAEWARAALLPEDVRPAGPLAEGLLLEPDVQALANLAGPESAENRSWGQGHATLLRRDPFPRTAPVGSFPPNPLGLFDLTGNVSEWTGTVAPAAAAHELPEGGARYVVRGGSWATGSARGAHPAASIQAPADDATSGRGFRVVLELGSE